MINSCKFTAHAKEIYLASVKKVQPSNLVFSNLRREKQKLLFGDQTHTLNHNIYIVGFGKAVCGMCRAAQEIVGNHVLKGALSVPFGILNDLASAKKTELLPIIDDKVTIYEGAKNNQPDEASHLAAEEIFEICKQAGENDLVITLVSGGGSALLPSPIYPLTLDEKSEAIKLLAAKGASIQEINVVRQNLSSLKGGLLAKAAHPAKMWSLILSDIIDSPIELIASGPTVQRKSNAQDALNILNKYEIAGTVSKNVSAVLQRSLVSQNDFRSTSFENHVHNVIIGDNQLAMNSAKEAAVQLGYEVILLSHKLDGEAKDLGTMFSKLSLLLHYLFKGNYPMTDQETVKLKQIVQTSLGNHGMSQHEISLFFSNIDNLVTEDGIKLCIISGGETTVTLTPDCGLGGRNQEMVLSFASNLAELIKLINRDHFKEYSITFLSAGTDGQDGPTPAAGAVFSSKDLETFDVSSAEHFLYNHDSYSYFSSRKEGLVITGLTGTNVMDIQILMISSV